MIYKITGQFDSAKPQKWDSEVAVHHKNKKLKSVDESLAHQIGKQSRKTDNKSTDWTLQGIYTSHTFCFMKISKLRQYTQYSYNSPKMAIKMISIIDKKTFIIPSHMMKINMYMLICNCAG